MTNVQSPVISIGMPVYNGEQYLAGAIESILKQSFENFELIICDNASTDSTEKICRDFAKKDTRVHYHRNDTNIGAHPNYNRTFELSSPTSRYFKWAAHDDLLRPDYLQKCIDALDNEEGSVVCRTYLQYIDADGNQIGVYDSNLTGTKSSSPVRRFASLLLKKHPGYEIMGVFRRSALEGSLLLQSFHGADRALLAELALRGHFTQVQEPVLIVRDHKERYSRAQVRPRDRANWHDTRLNSRWTFPTWRLYGEYWSMVGRNLSSSIEKLGCYGVLVAWWGVNWNAVRMLVDVISVLFPDATYYAEKIKQKLFSPAPGSDEVA